MAPAGTQASSHREAPLIAGDAYADNTDTYVFISPENDDNIVLVASYIPFEAPEGGPNSFAWDDNVLYDIYVDNDGDAEPDFTYTLQSESEVQNSGTFLYNTGPVTTLGDPNWNQRQTITVTDHGRPVARIVPVGVPTKLEQLVASGTVSYTHLTLPTSDLV